jgi:hypothetical protein
LVYMDSRNAVPTQEIRGRDGLRPVFENLSTYEATTHFNGQTAVAPSRDRSPCTAEQSYRQSPGLAPEWDQEIPGANRQEMPPMPREGLRLARQGH